MYPNNSAILYQDEHLLIVNKPTRSHFDEQAISAPWKPLHRLDFETSGCLAFSSEAYWNTFQAFFKEKNSEKAQIKKLYLAGSPLSTGQWTSSELIQGFVQSRYRSSKKVQFLERRPTTKTKAHSLQEVAHRIEGPLELEDPRFELARKNLGFTGSIFQIELLTGARHQIRAFFAAHKAPLVGDPLYGPSTSEVSIPMELHAWKLEIWNPYLERWARAEAGTRPPTRHAP